MRNTLLAVLLAASALEAAEPVESRAAKAARSWHRSQESAIVEELRSFVAIPNLATDKANIERNAAAIVEMFGRRGITARLLRLEGAPPLVVADWKGSRSSETIAFYAHYDGQPADASKWNTPPWEPVVRDGRLWGRSASDDKAPIVAMLAAIDAMKAARIAPSVNIRFVFDGEEEAGSPHLQKYLDTYAGDLAADAWMICDGPVHQSRQMQLYFGVRGVTGLELTVYGPARALHSGHYGNWAPNPIVTLAGLIASMRDTEGRILIPGFYADVASITGAERSALAALPATTDGLRGELALGRTEGQGKRVEELILAPAMNLRGFEGGRTAENAANAIPTEARASIDFRLVPNQTPEKVRERVESFLTNRGFHIVRTTPDAATRAAHPNVIRVEWEPGYPAARTALDAPLSLRVISTLTDGLGTPPLLMPTLGGSVPIHVFTRGGKIPAVGVPIVNHDNNQHAANENLRLQNLWDGIEVFAALFAGL